MVLKTSIANQVIFNSDQRTAQDDGVAQERRATEERTDRLIVEAERQKLALEKPPTGNTPDLICMAAGDRFAVLDKPGSDDLECDNKLYGLSVHLDHKLKDKIVAGEYVKLSQLLPKDKLVPDREVDKVEIIS